MEHAPPIPVDYIDPQPVCVCPDMGKENVTMIAHAAYDVLKSEQELITKLQE